ncbi:tRNA (adenosine(37)-N6)-threonylcarbamoyltransferase complex dimerization subunit type 1 TsaB [Sphingomonas baiyangensis]|uniref:tRNA (Adenosine(37)-N6)-threonylcarbamoyltransferase complex dimerization subunit type 1 TsaB n=1 Tax=Sphingomonas baiyangensis TaxID=2572576 RepID=A0A4U1L800_9SPHN|nr:tRNA (adenosine(37)-N6)-threonylcarbamoyltransferase complex dimerization subunit type 1 TsaB [Sphingomonas baiyangensis]TKD53081.1 tRNA (adenosine(37)-N6)-threonylcarbamoyltransferase complex dimerization subunit type 1 TsaB [Sphingomonas baiyangensis]
MRTLVIETATAACSVALFEDGACIDARHDVVGRGHAERLLPMIATLAGGGRADRILVDCGPGSFTGIRVGIAAAHGLALGWGVPAWGFSALALVAAAAFAGEPAWQALAVVMEGGHGEVFMQPFAASPFDALEPFASLRPATALERLGGLPAMGDGVRHLLAIDPATDAREAAPRAADALLLPAAMTSLPVRPIYGRAPDARPAAARAPVRD